MKSFIGSCGVVECSLCKFIEFELATFVTSLMCFVIFFVVEVCFFVVFVVLVLTVSCVAEWLTPCVHDTCGAAD